MLKPAPVYALNLDRSADRFASIVESAAEFGIEVTRVPAVDGRKLTKRQEAIIDVRHFERVCGKRALPTEVGCYLSHLKALELIAEGDQDFGVIVEDDIRFTQDFPAFVNDLGRVRGWDMVKLTYHRTSGYMKYLEMDQKRSIGRCLHGPIGSGAAYAVTREAARKFLQSLRPMVVPIDVEMERGWAHGLAVFNVDKPVVSFSHAASTIVTAKNGYKPMKFPFYRRLGTLMYRTGEYVRRVAYALTPVPLTRDNDATP
ncbi:glycosyltransferase family 25 protein [Aminobacter sp. HY435]|uniref:glycosyltransferase family 25 protein n=1 Tax=Aminobacter sp. HY435 TaxID=2970917 RepID=UPI0022B97B35|nr:glycosyltransferase family 25 protein [Aminobacter sp. HY435]